MFWILTVLLSLACEDLRTIIREAIDKNFPQDCRGTTADVRSPLTLKKTEQTFDVDLTDCLDSNFQLDAVPTREAGIQQRMELQKEVDALKVSFEKQVGTRHVGGHNNTQLKT